MFSWKNRRHFLDCTHSRQTQHDSNGLGQELMLNGDGNRIAITFAVDSAYFDAAQHTVTFGSYDKSRPIAFAVLTSGQPSVTVRLDDVGDVLFGAIWMNDSGAAGSFFATELLLRKEED